MPEISIIVPVYNVQLYLRACMDSLIGQTFRDIEIICVDDGSTDDSPHILAEYAAMDARVRVLSQPNGGQGKARNIGLTIAKAPFIMFCDSDDWYAPTMCEKMHAAMQGGADMAMCGAQEVADGSWQRGVCHYLKTPTDGEVPVDDDMLMHCNVCLWNKIHRRSILERGHLRFPDGLFFEDEYFFATYSAYVRRIAFVPDKLYYYRRRLSSTTGRVIAGRAGYIEDYAHIANHIWRYHEEHGLVKQRLRYLVYTWLRLCSAALGQSATLEECANMEKKMIAFAEAHIIPRADELPPIARHRLRLLSEHRWVGLHRCMGGHILSRCKERVSPKCCKLRKKYYWRGIPFWVRREWLSPSEDG